MQPFTTRRAFPLGPMPELRLERAPILTPEYRGKTPRAALHRMQREQLALLAHTEAATLRSVPTVADWTQECEPSQWPWTLASIVILVLVVAGALGFIA